MFKLLLVASSTKDDDIFFSSSYSSSFQLMANKSNTCVLQLLLFSFLLFVILLISYEYLLCCETLQVGEHKCTSPSTTVYKTKRCLICKRKNARSVVMLFNSSRRGSISLGHFHLFLHETHIFDNSYDDYGYDVRVRVGRRRRRRRRKNSLRRHCRSMAVGKSLNFQFIAALHFFLLLLLWVEEGNRKKKRHW